MNHAHLILFFLQIGVMLATALVCGQLMRRLRQPAVLGELAGGVLLGPTIFGMLFPAAYGGLFPDEPVVTASRNAVIQIGMLFFLFVAGLEVKLTQVRQRGRAVLMTSLMGILLPFALGAGAVLLLPNLWGAPAQTLGLTFAMFIGAALSISALPVIARILMDLKLIQEEIGVVIMSAATVNDLLGWSLFALILSVLVPPVGGGHSLWLTLGLVVGFAFVVVGLGHWLAAPLLRWTRSVLAWPSGLIAVITILVLVAAAVAESIGIHAIFGAFLVGIAFGQQVDTHNQAHDVIYQFAVSFFAPLYFVSVGLKADFAAHFDWPLVLLVLVIALVGKVGGAGFGAWAGGMRLRDAAAIGFGLNARGAMEMILASVALELGVIDQRIFVALIVMALVTSMLTAPALHWLLRESPRREAAVMSQEKVL